MTNSITNPNNIQPELWPAILAKLTIGNFNRSDELYQYLESLPTDIRDTIVQNILRFDAQTDLNVITDQENRQVDDNRFLLHTAAEALLPQPDIDWIVDTLFSPGTLSLVVGDPGSKKTYSMLDLAVCLAKGKSWLDFETRLSPVLLVDEESGVRRINRRLGNVMRGHSADGSIPLQYISLARFNFSPSGNQISDDLVILEEKINETRSEFVIIDALADVMLGADENSVKDVQPIFMGLRTVADSTQSAIALIHHSNRAGNYRGSSAISGALDVLMMVKSRPDSPNIDFEVQKNRDDKPITFAAVAHFGEGQFFLSSSQYIPKSKLTRNQKTVVDHLKSKGASPTIDITSNEKGSPDSIRKAIYQLVEMGFVVRVDGGTPGQKATYDLTEKGKEIKDANV